MPTHKKGHDKDKYYHLAKDQGFRSRAAFKLIQINKRFDFLSKARVCVDLCAAPGGWCQVAAKEMPAGSIVLGIDLLPIKTIRNVKTIVADITTAECRKMVVSELQGWKADVVLCDGAPNIGSAYSKDAYVQNELVIAALKTATDHLVPGGTFCTKVYRSTDYNAIVWVLQQLFEDVQTIKPNSSRSQSSEIFIVCLRYTAPGYIDPKLLDPNHVFKEVVDPGLKKVDIFHKLYDKSNKRHRTGYEDELGMTLRSHATVSQFIASREPIQMLTDINELRFETEECEIYKTHPKTKPEIVLAFADLRVLGKNDFKKIVKWRQLMVDTIAAEKKESSANDGTLSKDQQYKIGRLAPVSEEVIEKEILTLHEIAQQAHRKDKKKGKRELAKERQRQNLGMTANAFDVGEDMELFNINEQTTLQQLHDLGDVDLADREDLVESDDDVEPTEQEKRAIQQANEDLDAQLEGDYERFMMGRRKKKTANDDDNIEEGRTVTSRKHKRALKSESLIGKLNEEDALNGELETYVKMLNKGEKKVKKDKKGNVQEASASESDSDSSEEEQDSNDDEFHSGGQRAVSRDAPSKNARMDKWFSHPIFKAGMITEDDPANKTTDFSDEKKKNKHEPRDRAEVALTDMPKTDKEMRKEARKKVMERQERKTNKRKANNNNDEETEAYNTEFVVVKQRSVEDEQSGMDKNGKKIVDSAAELEYREMIKRGMGHAVQQTGGNKATNKRKGEALEAEEAEEFQVVPALSLIDSVLPVKDKRSYDSDAEEYDAHDRMTTLALATMMLRQSRKKAFVDASYNRFSWNDPKDLPSWFQDDEVRHNKPQLPIPAALLEQIKSRYQATGTREIKKVAEARMRKKKRAASKLKTAKKQASLMAENAEMSEKQKVKAISRAMKTTKIDKPGKVYVVTKQTGGGGSSGTSKGGKGQLKFVDKRMKKDTRAMKKVNKAKGKKRKH